MEGVKLKDILEKRNEILTNKDDYVDIFDEGDEDDNSETYSLYKNRKKISESIAELTKTVKFYLERNIPRKNNCSVTNYFLNFIGISGLIVFNDYILLNYFV
tara:strand:- start:62 stop:367 length:306 start_codon:yes stop_codon:yes gene_type:complete